MKKLFLIVALAVAGVCSASAQQTPNHCVAFAVGEPRNCEKLTPEQINTLKLKCLQILTRNNASRTAFYNAFVIYPILEITDQRTVSAGTSDITVIDAELTLVAENVIDRSNYGSAVMKLQGSGNSAERAFGALFYAIKPADGFYTGFIKKSTDQILKYYAENMGKVLNLAQTLVAAEQYQEATDLLCSIPFCVPAFDQSLDAINGLLRTIAEKNCRSAVEMAQRYIASGHFTQARQMLNQVKPGSTCGAEIQKLLEQIKDKKDENTLSAK